MNKFSEDYPWATNLTRKDLSLLLLDLVKMMVLKEDSESFVKGLLEETRNAKRN